MNAEKCVNVLGNIFHFETITGENGNYELSSNYWDLKFNVDIYERHGFISIVNRSGKGGANCRIESDEDEKSIASTITYFIGRVIMDVAWDKSFVYDGTNGILAWPYNCNFAYIDKLKECMNEGESETYNRVESSRKPIKSAYKGLDEEVGDLHIDMTNTGYFEDGWLLLEGENELGYRDGTEFTINAYGPNGEDLGSKKFDFLELWHNGKPVNSSIQSSMQGQERGIQAIMDEYGCTREEALEIMNGEVTSGCHGDSKKKKAKKEIKSNKVEKLIDYVKDPNSTMKVVDYDNNSVTIEGLNPEKYGEFNGYETLNAFDSLWKGDMDINDWIVTDVKPNTVKYTLKSSRQIKSTWSVEDETDYWTEDDEERLRGEFADERGLNLNEDEFPEDEYEDWVHQGAAMYSSRKPIKSSKTDELYERILKFYSGDARVREAQSFEDIADYMFGLGLDKQYSDDEIYNASRWVYDDICDNEIESSVNRNHKNVQALYN